MIIIYNTTNENSTPFLSRYMWTIREQYSLPTDFLIKHKMMIDQKQMGNWSPFTSGVKWVRMKPKGELQAFISMFLFYMFSDLFR